MARSGRRDPKGNDRTDGGSGGRNWEWTRTGDMGGAVSWADVDAEQIRSAINAVASAGAAILFSTSSDGGVLSLLVMDGDQKPRFYPKTAEQAEIILSKVENMFSEL